MSFFRIKTIKGRKYLYRQTSVREGNKVRSVMEYLGAIGAALVGAASNGVAPGGRRETEEQKTRRKYLEYYNREMASVEREEQRFAEWQKETFGETGEERALREKEAAKFSQEQFLKDTQSKTVNEASDETSEPSESSQAPHP